MKHLIALLLLTLTLQADYLYTGNNHCINNLVPNEDKTGWCWHDIAEAKDYCDKNELIENFYDGYSYVDGQCLYKNDLTLTGLTQNEWNYMIAIMANMIGFTMFFMINFLSIMIARK